MDEFYDQFPKEKYGISKFSVGIVKDSTSYFYQCSDQELYDLASISKLFLLNLIYGLEKQHYFSYQDSITDYLDLPKMQKWSIWNLLQMKGILRTCRKLSEAKDETEFWNILSTVHLIDTEGSEYSDIGFCLLGKLIEKVTGESLQKNYEDLFQTLGLFNTHVLPPMSFQILGNGNSSRLPHDLKTRKNGGVSGAAGVFSNVSDLALYAGKILRYEVFDENFIQALFHYSFLDSSKRKRTLAGLYRYTDDYRCYVGKKFSKHTLAHQGFTGAVLLFDFENKYVNVLLFDAIQNESLVKNPNFFEGYYLLQDATEEFTINWEL